MFQIPQVLFDTYNQAMDVMIDNGFGIQCTIHYPTERVQCANCLPEPATGKSANIYNGTGPIPFQDTFCPYCNGEGFSNNEATENIMMRCYFTAKNFIKLGVDLKSPQGATMQSIGHLRDMQNCRRAAYIQVNTAEGEYGTYKYRLAAEPQFHGFQRNKYFIANWTRVE